MEEYKPHQGDDDAAAAPEGAPDFAEAPEVPFEDSERSAAGRNATMILVALLVIGAGAVYFMRVRSGPKSAVASTPEALKASKTITTFLTDGGKDLRSMQDLLRNTEKIVQQFLSYPSARQVALEDLKTNPFQFGPGGNAPPPDDRGKKLEEEKQAFLKGAGALKLQSIMAGGSMPTCMIGGRAYLQGQDAGGYVIEKIEVDGVIVRRASAIDPAIVYKARLAMRR